MHFFLDFYLNLYKSNFFNKHINDYKIALISSRVLAWVQYVLLIVLQGVQYVLLIVLQGVSMSTVCTTDCTPGCKPEYSLY